MTTDNQLLELSLELHGGGWATFKLCSGGTTDEVAGVSYLGDPLAALLAAAVSVALRRVGEFVLHQEPGAQRYAIVFDAAGGGGRWTVARYAYDDDLDDVDLPPIDREPVFSVAIVGPDAFARAVLTLAENVVSRHGEEGYEAMWDSERLPFPTRGLAALRAALAIEARLPSGSR